MKRSDTLKNILTKIEKRIMDLKMDSTLDIEGVQLYGSEHNCKFVQQYISNLERQLNVVSTQRTAMKSVIRLLYENFKHGKKIDEKLKSFL